MIYQRKPVVFTVEELQSSCGLWQERLRIQDWEIRLFISRHDKMDGDTLGNCRVIGNLKIADIHLIDPIDVDAVACMEGCIYDMEKTLVHECLHVLFWDSSPPEENIFATQSQEQAIELTAMALVAAYRKEDGESV